jgi:hypothetical protein
MSFDFNDKEFAQSFYKWSMDYLEDIKRKRKIKGRPRKPIEISPVEHTHYGTIKIIDDLIEETARELNFGAFVYDAERTLEAIIPKENPNNPIIKYTITPHIHTRYKAADEVPIFDIDIYAYGPEPDKLEFRVYSRLNQSPFEIGKILSTKLAVKRLVGKPKNLVQ